MAKREKELKIATKITLKNKGKIEKCNFFEFIPLLFNIKR
jgi:hypothetical protein